MHDLPFDRGHRIERDGLGVPCSALRGADREGFERCASPCAIARRIDDDLLAVVGMTAEHDRIRQVLDRVDRLAVAADQHAEV